jgi:hypothetical protein
VALLRGSDGSCTKAFRVIISSAQALKQLGAPALFGDLGFSCFSDHALDLGEQGGSRVGGG